MDNITIAQIRKANFCAAGVRDWCKAHEFPIRDAFKTGIPRQLFVDVGDQAILDRILEANEIG